MIYLEVEQTILFFHDNYAQEGNVLYDGLLDRCYSDFNLLYKTFLLGRKAWSIFSNVSNRLHISSDPLRVCPCLNDITNCSYKLPVISRYRGQIFHISIATVDQNENSLSSKSVFRTQFPKHSSGELGEGEYIQTLQANCSKLTYHMFSPQSTESVFVYNDDGPCRDLGVSKFVVTLNLLPCPLGFQSSEQNTSCVCHKPLQSLNNLITCDINTQAIQREGNFWFNYENQSLVIHPHYPFDFCIQETENITIADIDKQCANNHSGTLCGACKTNLSLSFGSSRCQTCLQANFIWLTFIFALAGLLLVISLLFFRFTVAVGTVSGLLFYANIIAFNKALLFPSGRANPLLVFIVWLNLDIGIETC